MSPRLVSGPARLLLLAGVALSATLAAPGIASADDTTTQGDTVVGQLVQAWPEAAGQTHEDESAEQPLSWVQTTDGDAVRVPTVDVAELPVGGTVSVTLGGSVADDPANDLGLDDARTVVDSTVVTPAPVAAATAHDAVTVVRVVPPGGSEDAVTVQQLVDAVDGPVAAFWAGQTGGSVQFGVTATTPNWVHTQAGCADPTQLWNEAAAAAGFQAGPGKHLLVYVSSASTPADCSIGLAEVGSGPGAGGRIYVGAVLPTLIAHELGHNLGLGHSSVHQCDGTVEGGTLDDGTCRVAAYRDYYDVMGASWEQLGSLNAAQAARLGVLDGQVQTVSTGSATVTLAPLSSTTGTRAVQLTAPDGDYWLEYRPAAGQDAWLSGAANRFDLDAGVLLHRSGNLPDTAQLLDATPSASADWDGDLQDALPVGVPVELAGGAFTITVTGLDARGATLVVQAPVPAAAAAAEDGTPTPAVLPATSGTGAPAGPRGANSGTTNTAGSAVGNGATDGAPSGAANPAGSVPGVGAPYSSSWRSTPLSSVDLDPQASSSSLLWLWVIVGLAVVGSGAVGIRAVVRARVTTR